MAHHTTDMGSYWKRKGWVTPRRRETWCDVDKDLYIECTWPCSVSDLDEGSDYIDNESYSDESEYDGNW